LPAKRLLRRWDSVRPAVSAAAESTPPTTAGPAPSAAARAPGSASTPPRARRARIRYVDGDLPTVELLGVERGDGALRLLGGGHFDETETARLPRKFIGNHRGGFDGAALGKVLAQGLSGRGVGQPAHIELRCHAVLLRALFRSGMRPNT